MWWIAFFSILFVALIIYALLAKKNTGLDKYSEKKDPADIMKNKPDG